MANTSHEIRTPLNAILGFDELILRDCKEERTLEYATGIKAASASLLDIINNILDLSKIESGKIELQEKSYSTIQLIDNVASITTALADKKGLKVLLAVDEKMPQYLIGDQVRIRQVLVNLVTNAVKYTEKGEVKIAVSVLEFLENENACNILFSVKDTGIGIREEDEERLFEKFERLDVERNQNVEGTGLGMSIVVKLLEAMGSHVELKSEYGKGSEFYFVIKQRIEDRSCIGSFEKCRGSIHRMDEQTIHYIAPDARILVVDDVRLNLQVAKGLLEGMELMVDTAESGKEAIELVKKQNYDMILMDHMMPEMDGVEATHQIRKLAETTGNLSYQKIPILALTANAISGMREKLLAEEMQDFISKPVESADLEKAVIKWLPPEKLKIKGTVEEKQESNGETEKTDPQKKQKDMLSIDIPGLDMETVGKYFTSENMFFETLNAYYITIPQMCDKIERYLQEHDIKNYTIIVHGLKSSSRLVGALELSEEAKRLEDYGHKEDYDSIAKETGHFLVQYRKMEEQLAPYFKKDEGAEPVLLSLEQLIDSLEQLKKAAEDFDMEEFIGWKRKNQNVTVPRDYREEWENIKNAVENVAFSDTIEAIDALILHLKQKN